MEYLFQYALLLIVSVLLGIRVFFGHSLKQWVYSQRNTNEYTAQ